MIFEIRKMLEQNRKEKLDGRTDGTGLQQNTKLCLESADIIMVMYLNITLMIK